MVKKIRSPQDKWPHQHAAYEADTNTQQDAWNRTVDALCRVALGVEALAAEVANQTDEAAKQTALLKSIDDRLQVLEANQE